MKHAKALIEHRYNGKVIRVGQVYPIRRTDYRLFEALGRVVLVPDPKEPEPPLSSYYHTVVMRPEAPKKPEPPMGHIIPEEKPVKRTYRRKSKDAE